MKWSAKVAIVCSIALAITGIALFLSLPIGECRTETGECLLQLRVGDPSVEVGDSLELTAILSASGPLLVRMHENPLCGLRIRSSNRAIKKSKVLRCSQVPWVESEQDYYAGDGESEKLTIVRSYSGIDWLQLSKVATKELKFVVTTELINDTTVRLSFSDDVHFEVGVNEPQTVIVTIDPAWALLSSREGGFLAPLAIDVKNTSFQERPIIEIHPLSPLAARPQTPIAMLIIR